MKRLIDGGSRGGGGMKVTLAAASLHKEFLRRLLCKETFRKNFLVVYEIKKE